MCTKSPEQQSPDKALTLRLITAVINYFIDYHSEYELLHWILPTPCDYEPHFEDRETNGLRASKPVTPPPPSAPAGSERGVFLSPEGSTLHGSAWPQVLHLCPLIR